MQHVVMWKWLEDVLAWLMDLLLYVPLKVWQGVLDALASLIEVIPVPDFMDQLGNLFAGISPSVAYFAQGLHLGTGLTMLAGAYVIRFIIRRLPVVG